MDLAESPIWKHADNHHGDGHPDRHGQYVGDGAGGGHLFRSGVHWTIGAGRFNHLAHSRHHHRDGSWDDTTSSSTVNHAAAATVTVEPVVLDLDTFVDHLDPDTVPDDMLPWLATWLGLGIDSPSTQSPQRHELRATRSVNPVRGTRRSIELAVASTFGGTRWGQPCEATRLAPDASNSSAHAPETAKTRARIGTSLMLLLAGATVMFAAGVSLWYFGAVIGILTLEDILEEAC